MKNWIFIFMISMITLPGYGKVKVQKPKMKHPTAFAILVDEVTYEKIPGAIEAYRDAIEKTVCRLILSAETGNLRIR